MSVSAVKSKFESEMSEPNQAMNPAIWEIVLSVFTAMAGYCKNKTGATQKGISQAVRAPTPNQRATFIRRLKKELGSRRYKDLGGKKYADRIMNVGAKLKVAEAAGLVKDVLS